MAEKKFEVGIDLRGNSIKNAGFEVVTSLPTTNNFVGRQVTYQGKSYIWDGSSWVTPNNVYEANLIWGGRNISGGYSPIDAAMVDELGANRLAFANPAGITIEYSTDGGATWLDYGASDAVKNLLTASETGFVTGKNTSNLTASPLNMLRVTFDTGVCQVYTVLNKIVLYVSTNGAQGSYVTIQKALQSTPNNYINHVENIPISGWSGYNVINIPNLTTYGLSPTVQYGRLRFIFGYTGYNGTSSSHTGLNIRGIKGFGGAGWYTPSNMAKRNSLFTYDGFQNATFPASVTSNQSINFDTSNIEPTQTGTVTKTSTWLWQYLTQSVNWLRTTLANHNHDTTYLGGSAQALDSAKLGGQLPSYYEPAFSKNTAFNKSFGTGSNDVASGNHGHSDLHSHSNKTILDAITAVFTTTLKANYDSAVTNSHTHSNSTALGNVSGTNTGDETTTRIGTLINGATAKTTPVDADMVGLMDSAASNILKKLSWANIKATLKTYFDTLYSKFTFYRVKVGSTYITSTTSSDTLEFVAGNNVTLTPDSTNKKITIAASGGGSSSQVQVDFNVTNVSDVRHILNKPAENRTVYNRTSTLVDRKFQVNPGTASGSYNEGIRIANSSQGYSLIALGADETTDTGVNADGNQWHIIKFPSGNIAICQGSDVSTGLSMEKGGDIYWRNTKLNGSGGTTSGLPHVQITLINIERIIKKGSEILFSSELFEYDTPEFDDELLWDNLDGSFSLAAGKRYEVMINIGFLINNDSGLIRINLKNSNRLIKRTGQTFLDGYGCLSMTCLVDGKTSIFFEIEKSNPDMEITLLTQECWFAIHEI